MNPIVQAAVIAGSLLVIWKGCLWWMDWRERRAEHNRTCTYYNRCPACRAQEEPPSTFDLWDRFR
jgi:hypothetical protein